MIYDSTHHMFYFLAYGLLAWIAEAVWYAVKKKQFVNRGLLTLPIDFEIGLVFSNIAIILPYLERNYLWMYLVTFANLVIIRAVLGFFGSRLTRSAKWLEKIPSGTTRNILLNALTAAAILLIYLLFQPILMLAVEVIPAKVLFVGRIIIWVLIIIDFITVLVAMKKGRESYEKKMEKGVTDGLSSWIARFVWRRLERAYPGISDEKKRKDVVFAKGMSMDKLVWVFVISALMGDIVETIYCRIVMGTWMSRSSVVFGPFSFVWGIGAVLLTVTLSKLKDKNDRWILLAGGILGGAFEYMCSVFTEIVFGKVFWDYSRIPLNIGGRTNVLFMFFWGILGLIWVKIAYPPLEKFIERFPPLAAKMATWTIVCFMVLNGLFTVSVMLRYNERRDEQAASNVLETFIDDAYDDAYVEHRWRNMLSAK